MVCVLTDALLITKAIATAQLLLSCVVPAVVGTTRSSDMTGFEASGGWVFWVGGSAFNVGPYEISTAGT